MSLKLKNYLIAPVETGLQNNILPWLLPEDAYLELTNAYVWRGRVRKRFGYSLLGDDTDLQARLRINIGTTDAVTGNFSVTVPGAIFAVGQSFSIGTTIFTVNATGTPATLLTTGIATGTYDTTSGSLVITGNTENPLTDVFFYPSEPVMGLLLRETNQLNFEETIGFDTQFAYFRSGGAWLRLGTAIWTGTDSDFFWGKNYRGANAYDTNFYVVNNVTADGIKYIPTGSTTWTTLRPQLNTGASRFLETALIIVGFKDRLLCLNTKETDGGVQTFKNRVRWSQNGNPTVDATSWLDDTPGSGGYNDAPTQEAIVTVEFIKDRMIVYFERSTWELVYTGDFSLPFIWQQINNELGAESTFSIIGFDKVCTGVGNVGIHSCNGVNVERIDQKIPNEVFKIHNTNDGPKRVYGIRDYYRELVYWTFPAISADQVYPNRILVWNYQTNTWAFFEDSFTCFGYFQKDSTLTWGTAGAIFGKWESWNEPWGSGQSQAQFPDIIVGNQQGFVFKIQTDRSSNCQSLYVTDMVSNQLIIINHNLKSGDYILLEDYNGITITNPTADDVYVVEVIDSNTIELQLTTFTGTYTGGAKTTLISNINILSKQWNPGTAIGSQFRLNQIDFLLHTTDNGEVSLDYYLNSSDGDSIQDTSISLLGSNVLYTKPEDGVTFQVYQQYIWHQYFIQLIGQFIQIRIYMNDDQMKDLSISQSDFQLNGLILYLSPKGRLTNV